MATDMAAPSGPSAAWHSNAKRSRQTTSPHAKTIFGGRVCIGDDPYSMGATKTEIGSAKTRARRRAFLEKDHFEAPVKLDVAVAQVTREKLEEFGVGTSRFDGTHEP